MTNGSEIAIIGMAGSFPGAGNLDAYWQNIIDGKEGIQRLTDEELRQRGVDAKALKHPNFVKAAAPLEGAAQFDARFFGYTPREAEQLGPQHRVFLQSAWHALDDANYIAEKFDGAIGIFAGGGLPTYLFQRFPSLGAGSGDTSDAYQMMIGNDKDFLATRAAYKLKTKGPAISVQTACSTSLVAVHMACQSLLSGECDMALAGGVSIDTSLNNGYYYEEGMIFSPDGHCRAFDEKAAGTVVGNGVGLVLLKPLEEAQEDGDLIHAVIKGSAVNNDGAQKAGYTAPSIEGQAAVISEALAIAEKEPLQIQYVEAHGTGTPMGDPIEVAALNKAYRTSQRKRIALGAVKPNIGHLNTASGIAGLLKTILALKHRQIPALLHFERPNPAIHFDEGPFYVNTELKPWESNNDTRCAGVSSFGIGGTNAHLILEEAPAVPSVGPQKQANHTGYLLSLSAKSPGSLSQYKERLVAFLKNNPGLPLNEVSYTLAHGRKHFEVRAGLVAGTVQEAIEKLVAPLTPSKAPVKPTGLAMMFSGQGSQRAGLGAGLYENQPGFRQLVGGLAAIANRHLDKDIASLLFPAPGQEGAANDLLQQTRYTQPALFVLEYALAQYWIGLGIVPNAMIGHSIGEYVAAAVAEVMSVEDAIRLVCIRGELMMGLPAGDMLAVPLGEGECRPYLSEQMDLAVVNAPESCVLAGPPEAIAHVQAQLRQDGVESKALKTSHAFHSSMMEPVLEKFQKTVEEIKLESPKIKYISNLTGTWIKPGQATDPTYYVRHLRHTVRFAQGVSTLLESGIGALLEVGPGDTLQKLAKAQKNKGRQASVLHTLPVREPQSEGHILEVIGQLWGIGFTPIWDQLPGGGQGRFCRLPGYAFDKQRYWLPSNKVPQSLQEVDDEAARLPVQQWLNVPSWQQRPLPTGTVMNGEQVILFLSMGMEGHSALEQALKTAGHQVITLLPTQAKVDKNGLLNAIDPDDPQAYADALDTLETHGLIPDMVVHAWQWGPPQPWRYRDGQANQTALTEGYYSAIYLANALADKLGEASARYVILANQVAALPDGTEVSPYKAMLMAPAKVIGQEYPAISSRLIDAAWPASAFEQEKICEHLVVALSENTQDRDSEAKNVIALRPYAKWEPSFAPLHQDKNQPLTIKEGGTYLITGGTGGMGLAIARVFAEAAKVNLVLVSRGKLPPGNAWVKASKEHPEPIQRARFAQLVQLEAQAASLEVISTDLGDFAATEAALQKYAWEDVRIDGYVHAAGTDGGGAMSRITSAGEEPVWHGKVNGLLNLHPYIKQHRPDFVWLCSSLSSFAAGVGQVGYSAANLFLDAYANWAQTQGLPVCSINWDAWKDTGMAARAVRQLNGLTEVPTQAKAVQHPLLQYWYEANNETYFIGHANPEKQWLLAGHKVLGVPTLPGTAYIDLLYTALTTLKPGQPVLVEELYLLAPLTVVGFKQFTLKLTPQGTGYRFALYSGPANQQVSHASGTIGHSQVLPESAADNVNPESLEKTELSQLKFQEGLINFDKRWENFEEVRCSEEVGYTSLRLPTDYLEDIDQLSLHPALLDSATGFFALANRSFEGDAMLPFIFRNIQITGKLPASLQSFAYKLPDKESNEVRVRVDIRDPKGHMLLSVEEYTLRKVPAAQLTEGANMDDQQGAISMDMLIADGISEQEAPVAIRALLSMQQPQIVVATAKPGQRIRLQQERLEKALGHMAIGAASSGALHGRPELAVPYTAPETETQNTLASIWSELLGIDKVGIHDDLFELGGHSLLMSQILSRVKAAFEVDIPMGDLFENPNIDGMATVIDTTRWAIGHDAHTAETITTTYEEGEI